MGVRPPVTLQNSLDPIRRVRGQQDGLQLWHLSNKRRFPYQGFQRRDAIESVRVQVANDAQDALSVWKSKPRRKRVVVLQQADHFKRRQLGP